MLHTLFDLSKVLYFRLIRHGRKLKVVLLPHLFQVHEPGRRRLLRWLDSYLGLWLLNLTRQEILAEIRRLWQLAANC